MGGMMGGMMGSPPSWSSAPASPTQQAFAHVPAMPSAQGLFGQQQLAMAARSAGLGLPMGLGPRLGLAGAAGGSVGGRGRGKR